MTVARWIVPCLVGLLSADCRPEPPKAGAVLLILIDRSESVNKPETRQLYVESLRSMVQSLGHGDVLVTGWITDRSASELHLPVNEAFPPFCPDNDNPLLVRPLRATADSALHARLAQLSDTMERLLSSQHRTIMQTAILQSLDLAQRVFAKHGGAPQVLVLMSDMVEESDKLDFAKERLTPARIEAIINELRTNGRLPDLRGIKVEVLGAATGSGERDRQIREFWFSLFNATGAELRPADYGAALIKFDVPHAPHACH